MDTPRHTLSEYYDNGDFLMSTNHALEGLKSIHYLSGIPEAALLELAASATEKTYRKNTVLINEGDDAGSVFFIMSGKVRIYLSNDSGRTVTLSTQESGSFFGELSLLDGEPRSASVMTLEPTVCLLIPCSAFSAWIERHPEVALSIIRNLARRMRHSNESIRGLALEDVYGRLVKTLNEMAVATEDGGQVIEGKPSHQKLANMLGCSREMVSRIMRDLIRGEYIVVEDNALRLNRKLPASW